MDTDVSGWILEFLLRQDSLDDRTLHDLIRVLPLPNNNPKLKKTLILRKLDSDIKLGTISERTIEFLEQIEELDLREGNNEVSEAMKTAYCTVAMHCTAKLIEEKRASDVKRIWSGRIREMEISDVAKRVGLVEDDLLRWMNDIEARVLDENVCENVVEKFKGLDVLEVLRRYVNEVKEKMGPSFLELACDTVLSDDGLSKVMGLDYNKVVEHNNQVNDGAQTVVAAVSQDVDANDNSKGSEPSRAHVLPKHKHVPPRCPTRSGHGTHRGAKIVDPIETSHNKYDSIPTPVVNKVQESLETSSFELHAMVKDPLVDALRLAESFKASTSGNNTGHDHVVGDRNGNVLETYGDDVLCRDQNKRPKSNLMERNNTAHAQEWSDPIDCSDEESPTRPHLPSPKKRAVSPLSIYKFEKLSRQRKKRRWTVLEEDTLRTGVQKYGKGNWKLILNVYRDVFEDRTEVDLKDKWRNLTRW